MSDGLLTLLLLSGIMAAASFLAGSLPLTFSLSPRKLRRISAIGAGLLIGTALIVIIPEGIDAMYTTTPSVHNTNIEVPVRGAAGAISLHQLPQEGYREELKELVQGVAPPEPHAHSRRATHVEPQTSHAWIGAALIAGFALMYLIEAVPALRAPPHTHAVPLSNLPTDADTESPSPMDAPRSSRATTLGLVIHAFADGIALGAASAGSGSGETGSALGLVVFGAILVHKAPAAFGLTSLLLREGLGKRTARAHLVAFSLAAPLGAIVTWILVGLVAAGKVGTWWTGVVLVFSGGTFLYVAMHAMQTVSPVNHAHADGFAEPLSLAQPPPKSSRAEVALVVLGMLLPMLTQVGHAHSHGS
ncbi:Zinc/iron permease [Trichodelitschia bisporula]|uniref:Zinc/iron permease n=1 Tax=Trichodelitschia bisporula TaxID=703511 RepID=A0A6G1HXJ0_9PEZI|nr:Zinc/iron permease [Trichodelitschia bisporula]